MRKISFAIVGGGPAAFYTAKLLSRLPCEPIVDIIEKQLCPFGLIRYGVAPDHLAIKKVQLTLSDASNYPNFRFMGNMDVGHHNIEQLKSSYSGIIYAYGASGSKSLSWMQSPIPSHLSKVKQARELVYWYNQHPLFEKHQLSLKDVHHVVIIGNGNVAIDIGRILLRSSAELKKTEISQHALNELQKSNVRTIEIVGRRGVTHSSFALKQVRDLHRLGFKLYAVEEELEESMTEASHIECTALGNHFSSVIRMNMRKVKFMRENFTIVPASALEKLRASSEKKIVFRYLCEPCALNNDFITFHKNTLHGEAFKQYSTPMPGSQTQIPYDLMVVSAGFQVEPLFAEHYNKSERKVNHSNGCVVQEDKIDIGTYAVGWCKNGAKGVIDETLLGCEETFNNIRIHLNNELLKEKSVPSLADSSTVSFQQYLALRKEELARGNPSQFFKKKMLTSEIRSFYGI